MVFCKKPQEIKNKHFNEVKEPKKNQGWSEFCVTLYLLSKI